MGARFLSSTGLGSGNLIGRAQYPPVPALDKNWSPSCKNRKHAFRNTHFQNTALRLLLFSVRQQFGLRAKNARAEIHSQTKGKQQNGETACVLGYVLKTQRLIMSDSFSWYRDAFFLHRDLSIFFLVSRSF